MSHQTYCQSRFLPSQDAPSLDEVRQLYGAFSVPVATWERQYMKASGFFSSRLETSDAEGLVRHSSAFRFLIKTPRQEQIISSQQGHGINYAWTEIGLWTQWHQGHSLVLICCISGDGQTTLQQSIKHCLYEQPTAVSESCPHSWHGFVLPHISRAFHTAVWRCRDLVRTVETTRPNIHKPRAEYAVLHEISRHAVHSTETISMAITVLESIVEDIFTVRKSLQLDEVACTRASEEMNCQKTLLRCEHGRSQALVSRLSIEIDLVRFGTCSFSSHRVCSSLRWPSTLAPSTTARSPLVSPT